MSEPIFYMRPPEAEPIPLLVSIPHTGTEVPAEIRGRFVNREVARLPDTDWFLDELYDFVPKLGATTVFARYSRYVVDLNRPKESGPLYPGRFETAVVPKRTFAGHEIYAPGKEPTAAEVVGRLEHFWQPYHQRIIAELKRLHAEFGYAMLFDAHSIRSVVPQFHDGELPGLMLGDFDGQSAGAGITQAVHEVHANSGISHAVNSPFKGGYITRTYGKPDHRLHALQLEMSQRLYMDEETGEFAPERAEKLRPVLLRTLQAFAAACAPRHS